jgi:hypothetical protein
MKKTLLILSILALLFVTINSQLCNYAAAKSAVEDFMKIINELKNSEAYEDIDYLSAMTTLVVKTAQVVLKTIGIITLW